MAEATIEKCLAVLGSASDCSDHMIPLNFKEEDVVKPLVYRYWCNCGEDVKCEGWCDSGSFAFFVLKDGRHVIAREDSDSSGHG